MQPSSFADLKQEFGLSDGGVERLRAIDEQLLATSEHTNLVARSSLPDRFERHYRDSLQLFTLLPETGTSLLDIGSGAGFPGLVLAALAEERLPHLLFLLCDSVGKKAAHLQLAAERAGLSNVAVSRERVEALPLKQRFDIITARAVTALPQLLSLAIPRLATGGLMIFPKGRRAQQEVDAAQEQWSFHCKSVASVTDPDAQILLIREPKRKR